MVTGDRDQVAVPDISPTRLLACATAPSSANVSAPESPTEMKSTPAASATSASATASDRGRDAFPSVMSTGSVSDG